MSNGDLPNLVVLTKAQIKNMFTLLSLAEIKAEDFKEEWYTKKYKIKGSEELNLEQYEEIIKFLNDKIDEKVKEIDKEETIKKWKKKGA